MYASFPSPPGLREMKALKKLFVCLPLSPAHQGLIHIEKGKASLYAMLVVQTYIKHNSSENIEGAEQQRILSEIFSESTLIFLIKLLVEK